MTVRLPQVNPAGGVRGDFIVPTREMPQMRSPLRDMADYVARKEERRQEDSGKADGLRLAEAQAAFARRSTEFLEGLDPLAPDYNEQMEAGLAALADSVASEYQMELPENQDRLNSALRVRTDGFATTAGSQRRSAVESEAERLAGKYFDEFRSKVTADPRGFVEHRKEFNARMAEIRGSIPPERLPAWEDAIEKGSDMAIVDGLAQEGDFDAARTVLDQLRDTMSPEDYEKQKRRIDALRQETARQAAENGAATRAELAGRLGLVETLDDLDALEADFAAAVQEGMFVNNDGDRVRMQTAITQGRREMAKEQRRRSEIYTAHQSGVVLDTQAEVDVAWDVHVETAARRGKDMSDPVVMGSEIAGFISRTGQVPKRVQGLMAGAEITSEPTALAQAAALHGLVTAQNPHAPTGAGDRAKATVRVADTFGVSMAEAATIVLNSANDPAAQAARRAALTAASSGNKDAGGGPLSRNDVADKIAKDLFHDGFLGTGIGRTFGRKDVTDAMVADYTDAYTEAFMLTGDDANAKKLADQAFREQYGVTSHGGSDRITKYPPENFLPPGLTRAQAAAVIDEELSSRFVTRGPDDKMVPIRGAVLVPAPDAGRRLASGLPPVYIVMAPSERFGGVMAPLSDRNGAVVQFTVPTERELIQNNMAFGDARRAGRSEFDAGRATNRKRIERQRQFQETYVSP
jgi:hypothetical protein